MAKERKNISWAPIIIIGMILIFILVILFYYKSNYQPNQDYNNLEKGIYQYTYSGSGENSYIHRPEDIVSITISGLNNKIKISKETEVSKVIISGENNILTFCNNYYPTPEFIKSGLNNQINYVDC